VPGKCVFEDLVPEVGLLKARADALRTGPRLEALEIDGEIEGTRVTGLMRALWSAGQVRCQYARIGARRELDMWIRHVVLNWAAPPHFPRQTVLIGRPAKGGGAAMASFRPLADPAAELANLLRLYWLGQQLPLPLFPETSRAYAKAIAGADGDEAQAKALQSARRVFEGTFGSSAPPERDDPNVQQVFGNEDPLDPGLLPPETGPKGTASFADIALLVFGPLLDHLEDA
jgi:exodeoxyribonuclease V gamma subunit